MGLYWTSFKKRGCGMGRGAGNARTEDLLLEIVSKGYDKYNPDSIFPLVINDFSRLKSLTIFFQMFDYF